MKLDFYDVGRDAGFSYLQKRVGVCEYCGKPYVKNKNDIEYKFHNKTFCCFDHKMKYIKSSNVVRAVVIKTYKSKSYYRCSNCENVLNEDDLSCPGCGLLIDWSYKK